WTRLPPRWPDHLFTKRAAKNALDWGCQRLRGEFGTKPRGNELSAPLAIKDLVVSRLRRFGLRRILELKEVFDMRDRESGADAVVHPNQSQTASVFVVVYVSAHKRSNAGRVNVGDFAKVEG